MKLVNWEERSDNFLGLCDTLVGFCHRWSLHQRPGVVASSCAAKAFPVCLIFSAEVQTAAFKHVKDHPHHCLLYCCFVFLMLRLCFSGAGTQQAPALYRFTSLIQFTFCNHRLELSTQDPQEVDLSLAEFRSRRVQNISLKEDSLTSPMFWALAEQYFKS